MCGEVQPQKPGYYRRSFPADCQLWESSSNRLRTGAWMGVVVRVVACPCTILQLQSLAYYLPACKFSNAICTCCKPSCKRTRVLVQLVYYWLCNWRGVERTLASTIVLKAATIPHATCTVHHPHRAIVPLCHTCHLAKGRPRSSSAPSQWRWRLPMQICLLHQMACGWHTTCPRHNTLRRHVTGTRFCTHYLP